MTAAFCLATGKAAAGRRVVAIALLLGAVGLGLPTAAAQDAGQPSMVLYGPPLDFAVVDPFRPPAHIGASGNRGLEYDNSDGAIVVAAAAGFVTFSGPVAGLNAITIQHADGIRTTYTGFLERWVDEGSTVQRGWAIGRAAPHLHFGAKIREHYLDPQILIDASEASPQARLVPPPG
jgi:murein DD-endopeptidase MepM/ murein hydrolase activator NlpD